MDYTQGNIANVLGQRYNQLLRYNVPPITPVTMLS